MLKQLAYSSSQTPIDILLVHRFYKCYYIRDSTSSLNFAKYVLDVNSLQHHKIAMIALPTCKMR